MQPIGVECVFGREGEIQVRRVNMSGTWQSVGQGRQWIDQHGRHVLVMLPNNQPRELILRPETMSWWLKPASRRPQMV